MRRMITLVTVALVMAALVMISALPVFAFATNPNANCLAYQASGLNQFSPGEGGEYISRSAQDGQVGRVAVTCAKY